MAGEFVRLLVSSHHAKRGLLFPYALKGLKPHESCWRSLPLLVVVESGDFGIDRVGGMNPRRGVPKESRL